MSENNTNDDMIYNWRNELKSRQDGMFIVAHSQAQKLKNQGFDKSEVVELLAAESFDLDVATRVASKLFDANEEAPQKSIEVTVVPTRYSDCAPIIEKTLNKVSSKEFVKKLCIGPHAIVKTDEKGISQWQRWADLAKQTRVGMDNLHQALKPYVEETMLNNVLLAQSQEASVKVAGKNKYVVNTRKASVEVDLTNGTSNSDKFSQGNYSAFGLADEFLVKAADTISPYQRLKKALKD